MKILVVDDEKVQLQTLKRGLRSVGYATIEASSGYDALRELNEPENGITMIITDYSMPDMNGLELLKKVKAIPRKLPVIMMTAYGENSLIIEALRNQCDGFIEKPFVLEDLAREIERTRLKTLADTDSHELAKTLPKLIHQINNPLSAILGSAELGMLRPGDAGATKKHFESIIRATDMIRSINIQILNRSKPPEEKSELIEINRLVEDCLDMFQDLMSMKKVLLVKSLGDAPPYISGDRDALEQSLKNLMLNAIDSMDGKSLKMLKVNTGWDKEKSSVSISIEDTGCGIPQDARKKVFDPYFTSKKNGTGLGLTVVKELVQRCGGDISVESKVDIGTTFVIRLPAMGPASIPGRRKEPKSAAAGDVH